MSLVVSLKGIIESVEPEQSQIFGWPVVEMKGAHVADVSAGGVWGMGVGCFVGWLVLGVRTQCVASAPAAA